jgi:hypothetical protein
MDLITAIDDVDEPHVIHTTTRLARLASATVLLMSRLEC